MLGTEDPGRAVRARLLYLLFGAGWDIYNSNGDQIITLSNIERKIVEADCFVFTPGATLEDMFKAISIFVGYQTLDQHLSGKPTVILNTDFSWDPFFSVLDHLNKMGTIKQDHRDFLLTAGTPEAVLETLELVREKGVPDPGRHKIGEAKGTSFDTPIPTDYVGNVCVFCSATLEDPAYLADGRELGRLLAVNRLGCVSGAGRSGIMGAVVEGSVGAGGWTAGSNVPHIIELEGLPDGLSSFWLRPDIYTRMEVMIENSNAFVIFPGGAGTVQELLALMIFKRQENELMAGKPVVIFNRPNAAGVRFWDPLIDLLSGMCQPGDFVVANELADILPAITSGLAKREAVPV
ncbi:LOG family protein [Luteolibacter flavescens]|uniref:AMP nucleosidase n=1 Tax=Luteolibacter flavescens TaxID=1859460 RepID=A0ABT3FUH6_9BACT|nr:LOG family protein [Luteolibacter flavescens]MCW1887077.1 LOG family protein [Luteolibacter flavescens]